MPQLGESILTRWGCRILKRALRSDIRLALSSQVSYDSTLTHTSVPRHRPRCTSPEGPEPEKKRTTFDESQEPRQAKPGSWAKHLPSSWLTADAADERKRYLQATEIEAGAYSRSPGQGPRMWIFIYPGDGGPYQPQHRHSDKCSSTLVSLTTCCASLPA